MILTNIFFSDFKENWNEMVQTQLLNAYDTNSAAYLY